ncbi:hypothetical protein PAXINDRAFT_14238 [Paxillus involutus ATCC 200175]|uniref:C2 domain-containing protein n=1 Tax=Paxillus involutus ATCC 200175 TaxID=664439 RepID=A0A0C9TZ92_PAXIN|nr:hypothetical protein PAXINDRAFT_14238 [Paxillus involutus ATCC 200175]
MLLSTLPQKSPCPISQDDVDEDPPPHAPNCPLVTNQQVVITKLRATDLAAGLRRIPAGFYISISLGDDEWRTSNKPVCLTGGATEWDDLIYLPSDLSCVVYVRVYASFELGHMLGRGELLRKLSITVGELLERSNGSRPIVFSTKEGEVVSSCSSLEVTAELRSCQDPDKPIIRPPTKYKGDSHSHRYHKGDPDSAQLDTTIMHFHHLVDSCPFPHPALSAPFSNLTAARFLGCRDQTARPAPIALHREALKLGTAGYPSHLLNLINLGIATLSMLIIIVTILLPLSPSRRYHIDVDDTEELRTGVPEVCPPSFQNSKPIVLSGAVTVAIKAKPRSQDEAFLA